MTSSTCTAIMSSGVAAPRYWEIGDDDQARIKTVRGVGYVLSKDGTVPAA